MQTNITGKHVFYFFVFVAFIFAVVNSFDAVEPAELDALDVRGEFMENCSVTQSGLECLCMYENMLTKVGEVGIYEIGEAVNSNSLTEEQKGVLVGAVTSCIK